ncbi:hypothetical protein RQP46_002607 [Phenoliferia psychrophenolica]
MARQAAANLLFRMTYQYIVAGVIGLLTVRNAYLTIRTMGRQSRSKGNVVKASLSLERILHHPIPSPSFLGFSPTILKLFIGLLIFAINVAFALPVSIHVRGAQTNQFNNSHAFALRCGSMALAQAPAVFSLTGRNSLVSTLTGIAYQDLRFAHKAFGVAWAVLICLHMPIMLLDTLHWAGAAGVRHLISVPLGKTGIVTFIGLLVLVIASLRVVRRASYELFLAFHLLGAMTLLAGLYYHVDFAYQPQFRAWVWVAVGFWAFERMARLVQFFSLTLLRSFILRPAFIEAEAQVVEGAILLRVPFPQAGYSAGQHAYLTFLDAGLLRRAHLLVQSHPFSIANVPSEDNKGTQLFVMRIHGGLTKSLASHLAQLPSPTKLRVAVEGPYGGDRGTSPSLFDQVLLVAGGSGITHCISHLSDLVAKAKAPTSRTTKVTLVWSIQTLAQCQWVLPELVAAIDAGSAAGVEVLVALYVTKDASRQPSMDEATLEDMPTEKLADGVKLVQATAASTSSAPTVDVDDLVNSPNTTLHRGRPVIPEVVTDFVSNGSGATLVMACGPAALADSVRRVTYSLPSHYSVELRIASFEC